LKPKAEAKAVERRQTDTAIFLSTHLAAALAGTSPACVRAMAMVNKIAQEGITAEKVIETVHIVRLAMATKIIGDA
jgi:hypothetical protein